MLLLCVLAGGCEEERDVAAASAESREALAALIPDMGERQRFEEIAWDLWGALEPHGCRTCHGADGAPGWGGAKMPYFTYFVSDVVSFLDVRNRGDGKDLRDLYLYSILAREDEAVRMPPPRPGEIEQPADMELLEWFSTTDREGMLAMLRQHNVPNPEDRLAHALGSRLLHINGSDLCFDARRLGTDPYAPSLCEPFEALGEYIATFRGRGADAWREVVAQARRINHYDERETVIDEVDDRFDWVAGSGGGDLAVGPGLEKLVYRFWDGWTVSYFTKPAPDDSSVALTATNATRGVSHRPVLVPAHGRGEPRHLDCSRYDPIYSPDYDESRGTGFVLAGRGGNTNSSYDRKYAFFIPPTVHDEGAHTLRCDGYDYRPSVEWRLNGISGYGTIAKIFDPATVASEWAPYAGKYVVMGKRWSWTVVDVTRDAQGRTVGFTSPINKALRSPICPELWRGGAGTVTLHAADSVLSPDGRWISAKRTGDLANILVSTRTCETRELPLPSGRPARGGKAFFSSDGRYVSFHAFGSQGGARNRSVYANQGKITQMARETVANIFIHDTESGRTVQLTHHRFGEPGNSYVALFPSFNGDASALYFHRQARGADSSQVVRVDNPLQELAP